jgi:uncharacterized protein (DUF2384 family)
LTDQTPTETDQSTPRSPAPRTRRFRPRSSSPRLATDAAERQGRVARLAWVAFGGRDDAVAFLNDYHSDLGGRPIDLAVDSETSCLAVEQVIAEHRAAR